MRVLIAVHGFPPTHYAGAERAAERIVHWLVARGHSVEVFAVEKLDSPGFRVETTAQDGFTVHRLFYHVKEGENTFRKLYDYPAIGDALRQILAAQPFDLAHMVSGYLLGGQVIHTAHKFNLPVVVTLTEYWFMCTRLNLLQATDALCSGPETDAKCARCLMEDKRRYRLLTQNIPGVMNLFWNVAQRTPFSSAETDAVAQRRVTLHAALDAADLVISPSRFLINKFAEFGFDTERYVFIRHGLGASAVETPSRTYLSANGLRLGYIGQLKQHKGVDLAVEAVMGLLDAGENVSLDIWGPETEAPDYVAWLKRRAAGYEPIQWRGRYNSGQLWDILSGFDALLVPSRWYENNPTVILEAHKVRLPVITTNLGGMAELVEHEKNGLVFDLNNPADLKRQIERLLRQPSLLEQFSANIPRVKTADEEVEEIFSHYQRLVQR